MNWAHDILTNKNISGIEFSKLTNKKGMVGMHLLCPTCHEKVVFVNRKNIPHFKHQSGNNNKNCESYTPFAGVDKIKQYGRYPAQSISSFDTRYKLRYEQKSIGSGFYLYIKLTEEQLLGSQIKKESIKIYIYKNGKVLHTQTYSISTSGFIANEYKAIKLGSFGEYIRLETPFGEDYIQYLTDISAFQVLARDNPLVFSAKQIDNNSRKLFINSEYLFFSYKPIYNLTKFTNVIKISKIASDDYEEYYVYHLIFTERSLSTLEFCIGNGFNLYDEQANLSVLWPPVESIDGKNFLASENIFFKTNFNFVFGETISTTYFDNSLKSVFLKPGEEILVGYENVFETFTRYTKKSEIVESLPELAIEYTETPDIEISGDNAFLFSSKREIRAVINKQNLKLTYNHEIRYYNTNYFVRCMCLKPESQYDYVTDVLRYSKVDEPFIPEDNEYYGRNISLINYLFLCRRTGRINTVLKKMIMEDI